MDINLAPEWKEFLTSLLSDQNYKNTMGSLNQFITEGKMFYPNSNLIFRAFDACPLEKVKVVILGQDPYHGIGQANGLSFSVNKEVSLPPSLKNIYKELHSDI